jgi:16S rRNA (cytidine1402-2'-O)-methyltransferase
MPGRHHAGKEQAAQQKKGREALSHSGTLYVVATPIGNLQDITLRALEVLKAVDVIAAEDTRHSTGLLSHFGIKARLIALHEHNERRHGEKILQMLRAGQSVALVSDAGTPGISDPGSVLVGMVREAGLNVVPLPGACAAIAALSAAGFEQPHFLFYGFLPASGAQRRRALEGLCGQEAVLVFYEAPHRVVESVRDMADVFGGERRILIARELTKTFETFHRCALGEAVAWLQGDPNQQRGEFVLLVEGASPLPQNAVDEEAQRVLQLLLDELPLKQAVKLATDISGAKKNALYELALELKSNG